MIDRMDKLMLAIEAAAAGQKLYGPGHPAPTRQIDLSFELLTAMLSARPELRLVCLDNQLLFDDSKLPSCTHLRETAIPRLTAHGIEWIEFRRGVTRAQIVSFLEQLARPPAAPQQIGTEHIRVGRLGRSNPSDKVASAMLSALDRTSQVEQLKRIWSRLRFGDAPDQHLGKVVESIRAAALAGADACAQLAQIKDHDEYTFVHTVNVGILSAALGEAIAMTANQVFDLTLAALLHDIGKQETPTTILNKTGKLDEAERKQLERHTLDGAAILLELDGVPDIAPIVALEHHANIDGSGYPRLGRNVRPHLASQIVHVADIFDALRTNRPYRAALDEIEAQRILCEGAGKAFEAELLDLFLGRVVKSPQPRPDARRP